MARSVPGGGSGSRPRDQRWAVTDRAPRRRAASPTLVPKMSALRGGGALAITTRPRAVAAGVAEADVRLRRGVSRAARDVEALRPRAMERERGGEGGAGGPEGWSEGWERYPRPARINKDRYCLHPAKRGSPRSGDTTVAGDARWTPSVQRETGPPLSPPFSPGSPLLDLHFKKAGGGGVSPELRA